MLRFSGVILAWGLALAAPRALADAPPACSTTLAVENRLAEPVTCWLDGTEVGALAAGERREVAVAVPGEHKARAVAASGLELVHAFDAVECAAHTWILGQALGNMLVTNLIGETAALYVDDAWVLDLPPLGSAALTLPLGMHEVAASVGICRHTYVKQVTLEANRREDVRFGPAAGRLAVENRTARPLMLYRNGHALSQVPAGGLVEYAGQPLGENLVEALTAEGRPVFSARVTVRSAEEEREVVVIAALARTVTVRNAAREAVKVDAVPAAVTLEAGAECGVEVDAAAAVVKAVGVESGSRYDERLPPAGSGETVLVLQPLLAGVVVENRTDQAVEVLLDGKALATLAAGGRVVEPRVGPGEHVLAARRGDEEVDRTSCVLHRDSWFTWTVAEKPGTISVVNGTREDVRLMVEGQEAGLLPSGTHTQVVRPAGRRVTLAAVGKASGQTEVLTLVPESGRTVEWNVGSTSGGLAVRDLGEAAWVVLIDGVVVRSLGAGIPGPVHVPVPPGEHAFLLVPERGASVGGLVKVRPAEYVEVSARGPAAVVEVRNRTGGPLSVSLNGIRLGTVEKDGSLNVAVAGAGPQTISASDPAGRREWRLDDVVFPASGSFGWTLKE